MDKDVAQKLFYPHSRIYKNKRHIHNAIELRKDSYKWSELVYNKIINKPWYVHSTKSLFIIHKLMFNRYFKWTGVARDIPIQKKKYKGSDLAKDWFAPPRIFPSAYTNSSRYIHKIQNTLKPSKYMYATLLDKLNFYHPFWNGNGRATKALLQVIALNHHQILTYVYDSKGINQAEQNEDIRQITKFLKLQDFN